MNEARALNRPLPAAVAAGGNRMLSYRNFPVFSFNWLARRTLLFAAAVFLWGCIRAFTHMAGDVETQAALKAGFYMIVGLVMMVSAGPALATAARHFTPPAGPERTLVILAILGGLGLAYVADMWSAAQIMRTLGIDTDIRLSTPALAMNILTLLAIYFFIGGGLALHAYLDEARRLQDFTQRQLAAKLEQQRLESDLQLSLLQAQVEPHFLFNTLATARSSLRDDPAHAEATLDALCDYLRATIPRLRTTNPGAISTLGEQLEICEHYLTIMQLRMGDRLSFSMHADTALRERPFPPFMLLALVENAVKHGLEPRREGGSVTIEAHADRDSLVVDVHDNGLGLGDSIGDGIGLTNIREQLRNRYGERARLSLSGRSQGGVRARLAIPLHAETAA